MLRPDGTGRGAAGGGTAGGGAAGGGSAASGSSSSSGRWPSKSPRSSESPRSSSTTAALFLTRLAGLCCSRRCGLEMLGAEPLRWQLCRCTGNLFENISWPHFSQSVRPLCSTPVDGPPLSTAQSRSPNSSESDIGSFRASAANVTNSHRARTEHAPSTAAARGAAASRWRSTFRAHHGFGACTGSRDPRCPHPPSAHYIGNCDRHKRLPAVGAREASSKRASVHTEGRCMQLFPFSPPRGSAALRRTPQLFPCERLFPG
jgi:hypothetical protein